MDGRDQPQQPRQRRRAASATTTPPACTTPTSLRAYRDYDDRWALAFLLEDIGQLAALLGEPRAGLASSSARRTGCATRSARRDHPALEEQLEAQLAGGADALDAAAYEAPERRGRELDSAAAIELALAFCENPRLNAARPVS